MESGTEIQTGLGWLGERDLPSAALLPTVDSQVLRQAGALHHQCPVKLSFREAALSQQCIKVPTTLLPPLSVFGTVTFLNRHVVASCWHFNLHFLKDKYLPVICIMLFLKKHTYFYLKDKKN